MGYDGVGSWDMHTGRISLEHRVSSLKYGVSVRSRYVKIQNGD
jgi:hypothetical protein